MGGLTFVGFLWTIVSIVATILLAGGVIVPEWLIGTVSADGRSVAAFFGAYKRCNYPIYDDDSSMIALVEECGRYTSLFAVPSLYWRLTILLVVAGASLSLLLSFLLLPSLCTPHLVNSSTAVIVGFFQIVAAVFVSAGLVVYPLGWDNPEVRGACGRHVDRYSLGDCRIGRAFLSMVGGCFLLVLAGLLSLCGGSRHHNHSLHQNERFIRGYDHARVVGMHHL